MDLDDLLQIKERERAGRKKFVLRCCLAAGCMSSDSQAVKDELAKAVKAAGLEEQVEVRGVGCMKLCCQGPLVQADPHAVLYKRGAPADAAAIVSALNGTAATLDQ